MSTTKPIRRVAIIGTGVIGASWSSLFLAKGLEVMATDVAPNAEAGLKRFVESAWPVLKRLGLATDASQSKLSFTADLATAVKGADLVQENGPERIEFKKKLYGELDELLPAGVIIASSSSGLTMSEIQLGCRSHPERCVIGHPFNPPIWCRWSRSWVAPRRPKRRFNALRNFIRGWENGRFDCTRKCRGTSPIGCSPPSRARSTIWLPKASSPLPMRTPPCRGGLACAGASWAACFSTISAAAEAASSTSSSSSPAP
jgi:hypothetical protein